MKHKRILMGLGVVILLWGMLNGAAASSAVKLLLTATLIPTSTEPAPDLVITHAKFTLDPTVSCFLPGMSLGLQVFFSNTGDVDAGSFTLSVDVNDQTYTTVIAGLGAGEDSSYWFEDSGSSMYVVQAMIDSLYEIAENDENNNSFGGLLPTPTPYISCTATPDPNITLTEPATPTATITGTPFTATPSVVPGYQPLENGWLEDDFDSNGFPDGWQGKNLFHAKPVCDKPGKLVAFRGRCAFQFKADASGKLLQKAVIVIDQAFTSLTFSAWMQSKNVSQGSLSARAKLVFGDDTSQVLELSNPTPDGTYRYVSNTVALEASVTKIVVSFRPIGGLNSKIRLDDVIISLE